jgi:acetolactate synthase-1/2/3 large subunit
MNGAHALLATLRANGVDVCFANPGTSEMHFVAALDDATTMRAVLCLFEGVATGAADGYGRIKGSPAATLLHLGPGLGNGWANLHNARRARTPLLNIVGDHATHHSHFDAPLQSNIEDLARPLEGWFRRSTSPGDIANDTADAILASYGPPGRVATLVLPADVSWSDVPGEVRPRVVSPPRPTPFDDVDLAGALVALQTKRCALFVGGAGVRKEALAQAQRIANATGAKLLMETFPSIMDRGRNVANPERLIYVSEFAVSQLQDCEAVILLGAREPVGFFAYPNVPSRLVPEGSSIINLAPPGSDVFDVLEALSEALNAPPLRLDVGDPPAAPTGELTTQSFSAAIGATLPEGIIVADESNTSGVPLFGATRFSPEHQWMTLTGGAIGYGLPVAIGAAIASGRRVLALESDGSMMYTLQALWTMAREALDITVVGLSNRSYAVLTMELSRVGAVSEGATSARMLELDDPTLDLAGLSRAQGVPSITVTTAEEFVTALERSYATPGPMFIEVVLPKGLH